MYTEIKKKKYYTHLKSIFGTLAIDFTYSSFDIFSFLSTSNDWKILWNIIKKNKYWKSAFKRLKNLHGMYKFLENFRGSCNKSNSSHLCLFQRAFKAGLLQHIIDLEEVQRSTLIFVYFLEVLSNSWQVFLRPLRKIRHAAAERFCDVMANIRKFMKKKKLSPSVYLKITAAAPALFSDAKKRLSIHLCN